MGEKRDITNPLLEVSFYCRYCREKFEREPERIENAPDQQHPYNYFHECPRCGREAPQAHWEKAMLAAYGKHTGPKTDSGKATSAKNIDGYPTQEQTQRTRFNGLKHGLYAKVLDYFPARPGQYEMCENCEIRFTICPENTVCAKEADRHMKYFLAFRDKDTSLLTEYQAALHANIQSIIDSIVFKIIRTGVEVHQPVWYIDKEDGLKLAYYTDSVGERKLLTEIKAHPLLKVLTEFLSRNSLSLGDLSMTPKAQEQNDLIRGHIDAKEHAGDALVGYQQRQTEALEKLQILIENSKQRLDSDPILIEHGQNDG